MPRPSSRARSGRCAPDLFGWWILATLAITVSPDPAFAQQPSAVPAFTVEVSLSAKAAGRLAALREGITLAAYYSGEPTAAARRRADQMGQINLGSETVTVPGRAGSATFSGRGVKAAEIAWVKDRDVQVLVNVYSARRGTQDNILECGLFEGALTVAAQAPVPIACKLIGEP